MKSNTLSPFKFLPRKKRRLGVGFVDMVGLARKSKPFRGRDDRSWQDIFLPAGEETSYKKRISAWVGVVFGLVAVSVLLIFLGRLWQLQVTLGQENLQASTGNRIRIRSIPAPRGVIYDRNAVILATNVPGFRLVGEQVGLASLRKQQLADFVAGLLGSPSAEVTAKFKEGVQSEAVLSSELTRDEAISLEAKLAEWPELRVVPVPVRSYPANSTLAHLLGYLGEINEEELANPKYSTYSPGSKIGRVGIEASYESILRGQEGRELVEVDARGVTERVIAREDPVAGRNLVLTVDLSLTRTLETELAKYADKSKSGKGAAVALNPQDGSVLAYVSWPSFDPNLFSRGITRADYNKLINDPNKPLFDRVIAGTYPPGSTFKPTVAAAALAEKVTTKDRLINSPGVIYLGSQAFANWRPSGFGMQGIVDAIAYSNDVYFYLMGAELGVDRLSNWARKFGFGEPSGINIPGEARGTVPTSDWKKEVTGEIWYPGDNYNYGIGQGYLLVSPLQLAGSIEAVSNGGRLFQPILIKEVRDSSNLVVSRDNPVIRRASVVSTDVLAIVKDGMKKACTLFVNLAGDTGCKTGSAEFGNDEVHAWFVAFAPWDQPEIVLSILVDGGGQGSQVAAPVARPILQKYLR